MNYRLFARELANGLLACAARMCIGLSDKVWLGHNELRFIDDFGKTGDTSDWL